MDIFKPFDFSIYINSKFAINIFVLWMSICFVKHLKDEDFIKKFGQIF